MVYAINMVTLPIAGTAMPILDTTTCMMACLAALGDSPNLLPFSSVTGIPYFNSLDDGGEKNRHEEQLQGSLQFIQTPVHKEVISL